MICRILTVTTALTILSMPAFAQTTTVREAVPAQKQTITAGSPQDLVLQEDIRKVRAFNAQAKARTRAPNTYTGRKIELFKPSTTITYTTASGARIAVVPTTITERKPAIGYTRIHRVVEGDTLYNLATRNCALVTDIQSQNALGDSNIRVGQVLTLPTSKCGAKTTAVISQTRSDTGVVRRVMPIQTGISVRPGDIYAVLPKDTLYSIGKRYCVKADALAAFNGLDNKIAIQPGQRLRLPSNACIK